MSVVDMNGGAGEGGGAPVGAEGGEGGPSDGGLIDVFGYLRNVGLNGIAINGILVWIDIQMKSTPENIWMAQAESHFADLEIDLARSSLWKAANDKKEVIGGMVAHKTPGKTHKNLVDIVKAMKALKEKSMLPLLLSTSDMMKKCPAFHCDKEETKAVDIMTKVKVLEESMDNFMKQQGDQMRNLLETVGGIQQRPPAMDNRVRVLKKNDSVSVRPRSGSPGKRPRIDDENEVFEDVGNRNKTAPSYAAATENGNQNQRLHTGQMQAPRSRRPSTLVFGEAKNGKNDTEELLAADANLVASGVSKDATCEQLKEFIESKGINVTDIELLSLAPERRTNTFRVAIKVADYDKALNPDVWPYRVGVRRYRPQRTKSNWASQSAQSGGNIHAGGEQHRHGQAGGAQYVGQAGGAQYGGHAGGAQYGSAQYGGQGGPRYQRFSRRDQYAPSAPSAPGHPQFYLPTENRFNGLQDFYEN